jgi:hypothetical protein
MLVLLPCLNGEIEAQKLAREDKDPIVESRLDTRKSLALNFCLNFILPIISSLK